MALRVRILGADSFGSRSMATVVEANGVKIVVDPGVSYAPRRYGLPPHRLELARLSEIRDRIVRELEDAEYVVITHYHYDHYLREPEYAELFKDKIIFVKHPSRSINLSQRIRAYRFLRKNRVEDLAARVEYADSRRFQLDDGVELIFSPPVPHGAPGTKLGYVVMAAIRCCGETFVHASDVQGPMSSDAANWILELRPGLIFISGPPTYFAGYKVPREEVERGLQGLRMLAEKLVNATIIADHHFARDLAYPEYLAELNAIGGARLVSAAEYMGIRYEPLEALRKRLWEEHREEAPNSD